MLPGVDYGAVIVLVLLGWELLPLIAQGGEVRRRALRQLLEYPQIHAATSLENPRVAGSILSSRATRIFA